MSVNEFVKLRKRLDLSQDQLSRAFGVANRNIIYRWENEIRKPVEVIRRLACLLNDLPKHEAEKFILKLEKYGKRDN